VKKARGNGLVYQPSYREKHTGDRRKATIWWIQYFFEGRRFRESSNSRVRHEAEGLQLAPGELGKQGIRESPLTPELRGCSHNNWKEPPSSSDSAERKYNGFFTETDGQSRIFARLGRFACERAGVQARVPDDLRRSAVRNLEYAGVPRSIAMAVGHRSDSIYRGIASVDRAVLKASASKLAAFHESRILARSRTVRPSATLKNLRPKTRPTAGANSARLCSRKFVLEFLFQLIHSSCF
jgi:hypothetical protein